MYLYMYTWSGNTFFRNVDTPLPSYTPSQAEDHNLDTPCRENRKTHKEENNLNQNVCKPNV
jgi:hypothetical protein